MQIKQEITLIYRGGEGPGLTYPRRLNIYKVKQIWKDNKNFIT
jgi:hypothetical protein